MTGPFRLNRSVVQLSGPDVRTFLGGLLTQSVDALAKHERAYAALLTPQGKVIADMIVLAGDAPVFLLDVDPTRAAELVRRLTLYKLRAQVSIDDLSDVQCVVWDGAPFEHATADPRLPALGWRRVMSKEAASSFADGSAAFDAHRLALGVPDLARDAAPDEVFALEALLEELNGVDFQKGCFVGQENVSRMKRRATTRKKFCPIVFEGEAPPPMTPIRAGEAELGTVRSGVGGRAIALLRLDRAFETIESGKTLTAGEREIRLDPPPWLILPQRDGAG